MITHDCQETTLDQLIRKLHAEDMAILEWRLTCEVEMDRYTTNEEETA